MERFTKIADYGFFVTEGIMVNPESNEYTGTAIDRLATFENIYEDLLEKKHQIPQQLEKLRNEGKNKTVRFRELMVEKMTNATIINLFKSYGL